MRTITVEVPNECTWKCPLAHKRPRPYNMFLECPFRDMGFDSVLELEPTEKCRDAEVKS